VASFSLDLAEVSARLRALRPDLVFNLVESVDGSGRFAYLAPSWLDFLGIPYSGCSTEAIFATGNKLFAKRMLKGQGIPTPPWIENEETGVGTDQVGTWIIKFVWEHASIGLSQDSVVSRTELRQALSSVKTVADCFAEAYIPGREFNISVLGGPNGPEVLPPAELVFVDFPEGRPKIVDYRAKWDEQSFEYHHTVRSFEFPAEDEHLLDQLRRLSLDCWRVFRLRGYARVDFRVDGQGQPWVLEINSNPCISRNAGFLAAADRAGLRPRDVVARIIEDSFSQSLCD